MGCDLPSMAGYKKEKFKEKLPQNEISLGKHFAWQRGAVKGGLELEHFGEREPPAGTEPGPRVNLCNTIHPQAGGSSVSRGLAPWTSLFWAVLTLFSLCFATKVNCLTVAQLVFSFSFAFCKEMVARVCQTLTAQMIIV